MKIPYFFYSDIYNKQNSMGQKHVNEGLLDSVKNFSNSFFDSLKTNTVNDFLEKARKTRLDKEAISKMEQIRRQKEELDRILKKYS